MKAKPYAIGQLCGAYVVVGPPSEGQTSRDVVYPVRCRECDDEYTKSHERLQANIWKGTTRCPDCCKQRPRTAMVPGERFGMCVILPGEWRDDKAPVRYDCCGKHDYLTPNRLSILRHDALIGVHHMCRPCYLKAHNKPGKRKLRAIRKAQREAAAKGLPIEEVKVDIRPPRIERLAEGLVSAATAWPRPASLRA